MIKIQVFGEYFSIWYISPRSLVIGISPIVSLKNKSSTVSGLIALKLGKRSKSLPNRVG